MPSSDGTLSKGDQEKISVHLNDKGKNHNCPVCGENNWAIGRHLLIGMVHTPNAVQIGGPSYPMAFISCNNCSFVRQFMAVPLGILTTDEPAEDTGNV
jgi:hypothetical protein